MCGQPEYVKGIVWGTISNLRVHHGMPGGREDHAAKGLQDQRKVDPVAYRNRWQ